MLRLKFIYLIFCSLLEASENITSWAWRQQPISIVCPQHLPFRDVLPLNMEAKKHCPPWIFWFFFKTFLLSHIEPPLIGTDGQHTIAANLAPPPMMKHEFLWHKAQIELGHWSLKFIASTLEFKSYTFCFCTSFSLATSWCNIDSLEPEKSRLNIKHIKDPIEHNRV